MERYILLVQILLLNQHMFHSEVDDLCLDEIAFFPIGFDALYLAADELAVFG